MFGEHMDCVYRELLRASAAESAKPTAAGHSTTEFDAKPGERSVEPLPVTQQSLEYH